MKQSLLPIFSIIIAFLFLLAVPQAFAAGPGALPPPAHSGQPSAAEALPPEGKPGLNKELAPPGEQQGVVIRSYNKPDGTTISEYAMHGRVYMIKVQPPGGLPAYYLYDTNGDGVFNRRLPGGYKSISPPSWVIHRF